MNGVQLMCQSGELLRNHRIEIGVVTGNGRIFLDADDADYTHILGDFDGIGTPWRNHGRAWTYEVTRSEEHTSELQSLMRISYAVFCLKKKKTMTSATY